MAPAAVVKEFKMKGDPNRAPPKITGKALAHLEGLFETMDHDGNGTIERHELVAYGKSFNLTDAMVTLAFALYDKDHDEALSWQDFLRFMELVQSIDSAPEIFYKRVFDFVDADHSGQLDVAEFVELMAFLGIPITAEEAGYELDRMDRTGLRKLAFPAFCSFIAAK
jgi:Ca2+-binding EF-hand superfamily protein